MKEKVLTTHKNGMAVLLGVLALYALAVAALIGGIQATSVQLGTILIKLAVAVLLLGWIPLCGLKVLKPQEALVLTLFGNYIGTLRGAGFYAVNPFCTAVNPAEIGRAHV